MPYPSSCLALMVVFWMRPAVLLGLLLLLGGLPGQRALAAPEDPPARPGVQLRPVHLDTQALLPGLALLRDPEGELTPAQVMASDRAADFVPLSAAVSAGYTRQTFWLRLRVQRAEDQPTRWWLQLDRGYLDDVALFHRHPDGREDAERRAGDRVQAVGAVSYLSPAFELALDGAGVHEIYLRVRTRSTMILQPSMAPQPVAFHRGLVTYLLNGLYFGACLTTMCVGLAAAVWLRQRLALLYALLALSATFSWWAVSGLAHQLMFALVPPMADRLLAANIAFAGAVGLMFYGALFELPHRTPRLWLCVIGASALMLLATAAPFVGLEAAATPWVLLIMLLSPLLMVPAGAQLWREGELTGRAICLAIVVYQALAAFNILLVMGAINPGPWVDVSGPIGNLVHLVSLLIIGAVRVREGEAARIRALQQASEAVTAQVNERRAREDQNHLLSMIAHEFRTPIAIIDASMQSLRLLDPAAPPERVSRHQRIARAIDRMSDLLELALTRDRLDVSAWQQNFAPVDLALLTRDTVTAHGPAAERLVRIQAPNDLPTLEADGRMLGYALLNLIDNALKYSPRDKPVDVMIKIASHENRPGLQWTVLDQGRGITAAQADRVFEKYFRAGENAEVPGIGLGLYLVRQIIARHQGWVRAVVAGPGNGGCFECWLPLAQQPSEPSST